MSLTRRTLMTAGAALALPISVLPHAAHAAAVAPRLSLPAPTGRYRVGTRLLHLVDSGRLDPLAPDTRARELIVRLFYPTASRHRPDATYLSPALSSVLVELINGLAGTDLPLDILTFRTHSHVDAPIAAACRRVVLFSPGLGVNAAIYTSLMEDLASRGYLVAGLDHTFDAVVEFPDGRVVPPAENVPFEKMLEVRTTDIQFVLDRLGSTMDLGGGVAAVGHSMGSMSAVQAILADRRIGAGVALDGNPLGQGGIDRPFMMLGNPSHRRDTDPDWAGFYDRLRGPRLHLVVEGMEHLDLSDLTAFKSVVDFGTVFELGPIEGLRAITITRAYVAAWLEHSFGGRSDPILRREPARFPEVDFQP